MGCIGPKGVHFLPYFLCKVQQESWVQVWVLQLIRPRRIWTRLDRKPQRRLKLPKIAFPTKSQSNWTVSPGEQKHSGICKVTLLKTVDSCLSLLKIKLVEKHLNCYIGIWFSGKEGFPDVENSLSLQEFQFMSAQVLPLNFLPREQ